MDQTSAAAQVKVETQRPQSRPADPKGSGVQVSLLTGGADKPYIYGLGTALIAQGISLDIIGSDELAFPEFFGRKGIRFLNLRGDQRTNASLIQKITRVLIYYARLVRYAATAEPKIFHIIWNNKFEHFDRTFLMLYYKLLGKKVVFTAHNVNAALRDGMDSSLNRLTLRTQYRLCDRIFVHTEKMKQELVHGFGVSERRVTVIPFGVNNAVPNTSLTGAQAREKLGIGDDEKAVLFFGNITPYKGLEFLVDAFRQILSPGEKYRLIIAGKPDRFPEYWDMVNRTIETELGKDNVVVHAKFVPDEETEIYFKAADALVLPYRHVYQSGVLFLSYSFGLPVLASDVGSLADEIVPGETGLVFKSEDRSDLARALREYFSSNLFKDLKRKRESIQRHVAEKNSWQTVGSMTLKRYAELIGNSRTPEASDSSLDPPVPA